MTVPLDLLYKVHQGDPYQPLGLLPIGAAAALPQVASVGQLSTVATSPPRTIAYSIRQGDKGFAVYALQKALISAKVRVQGAPDGDFGAATATAVRTFQNSERLTVDGVAGPATQARLLKLLGDKVAGEMPKVPTGLMRGYSEGEGANVLAAVNWSIPGGVDCGCMQIRAYGPPYAGTVLERCFHPYGAMLDTARALVTRAESYLHKPGAPSWEMALRLGVMAHNWPAGAEDIVRDGALSNPDGAATWVHPSTRFPDGAPVRTRKEWVQFYALGGPHGEGAITKYVHSWAA